MTERAYSSSLIQLVVAILLFCRATGCTPASGTRIEHYRSGGLYVGGSPSVSQDGQTILYSSPRSGNGDLYRVSIDGSITVQLTDDPDYDGDAQYAKDGRKIVFIREKANGASLWIMNSDGSSQRQLLNGTGDLGGPRFSPDGSQVVFWRTTKSLVGRVGSIAARELYSLDLSSGKEVRLTNNNVEDVYPAFATTENRLLFSRDNNTWLMETDSGNERRLTYGVQASISPDGFNIVVVGGRYGRQIDIISIDGTIRRTLYSRNTTVRHPTFLPDGMSIVFLEFSDGRKAGDILLIDLDSEKVVLVARTE